MNMLIGISVGCLALAAVVSARGSQREPIGWARVMVHANHICGSTMPPMEAMKNRRTCAQCTSKSDSCSVSPNKQALTDCWLGVCDDYCATEMRCLVDDKCWNIRSKKKLNLCVETCFNDPTGSGSCCTNMGACMERGMTTNCVRGDIVDAVCLAECGPTCESSSIVPQAEPEE